MKKILIAFCFVCLATICKAQYIGSGYLNLKFDYIVDKNQVQGTVGYGKVFKTFKLGADLNYRNLNQELVSANTVTIGPEFSYWLLKSRKFSFLGVLAGTMGFQQAKEKSELVYLEENKTFVYGYEVGVRPEVLLSPKVALFAEYRFEMLFNSILRNNNHIGWGCVIYL